MLTLCFPTCVMQRQIRAILLLLVMRNGSSALQTNNITFVDKRELRGPSPGTNYVSQ